jgi:hypothetical protein
MDQISSSQIKKLKLTDYEMGVTLGTGNNFKLMKVLLVELG